MTAGDVTAGEVTAGDVTLGAPDLARLDAYGRAWEELAPDSVSALSALLDEQVRFLDPFNELTGRAAFERLLRATFEHLETPHFTVQDTAISSKAGYLRWRMTARSKRGGIDLAIEGMSEVHFSPEGLVTVHIDHWDAAGQLYEKVPLLGRVLAALRRRIAV